MFYLLYLLLSRSPIQRKTVSISQRTVLESQISSNYGGLHWREPLSRTEESPPSPRKKSVLPKAESSQAAHSTWLFPVPAFPTTKTECRTANSSSSWTTCRPNSHHWFPFRSLWLKTNKKLPIFTQFFPYNRSQSPLTTLYRLGQK